MIMLGKYTGLRLGQVYIIILKHLKLQPEQQKSGVGFLRR